jgi:cyclic beta-1,2-glucan synthetase
MYQAAIEGLLGLRRGEGVFGIDPSIPGMWAEYSIDWKVGRSLYLIVVRNPERRSRGVQVAELDGRPIENPLAIPLLDDGDTHHVVVTLGAPVRQPVSRERSTVSTPQHS